MFHVAFLTPAVSHVLEIALSVAESQCVWLRPDAQSTCQEVTSSLSSSLLLHFLV